MKAAMFILIPKSPHFIMVNLSFFSIGLLLKNRPIIQKIIVAPKTLKRTKPKEPIYIGMTILAIV